MALAMASQSKNGRETAAVVRTDEDLTEQFGVHIPTGARY